VYRVHFGLGIGIGFDIGFGFSPFSFLLGRVSATLAGPKEVIGFGSISWALLFGIGWMFDAFFTYTSLVYILSYIVTLEISP